MSLYFSGNISISAAPDKERLRISLVYSLIGSKSLFRSVFFPAFAVSRKVCYRMTCYCSHRPIGLPPRNLYVWSTFNAGTSSSKISVFNRFIFFGNELLEGFQVNKKAGLNKNFILSVPGSLWPLSLEK